MHTLLAILSISLGLLITPKASPPNVGFLRIYNCLSNHVTLSPLLDGKPLLQTPLKPSDSISGMYFKAGRHRLKVELSQGRVRPTSLNIPSKGQLTIIAFHKLDPRTQRSQPRLISLLNKTEPVSKGFLPLRLKSLSNRSLTIDLGFDQIYLEPMSTSHSHKWQGQSVNLAYEGKLVKHLPSQGDVPHTILIWDEGEGNIKAAIVESSIPKPPKGLRKDLTFGPKRSDLPYLKKMN